MRATNVVLALLAQWALHSNHITQITATATAANSETHSETHFETAKLGERTLQKVVLHEIQHEIDENAQTLSSLTSPSSQSPQSPQSPFLSATLSTTLSPVPTSINAARQTFFEKKYLQFLQKIFEDQEVYDVVLLSVDIFEERLERGLGRRGRRLDSTRQLSDTTRNTVNANENIQLFNLLITAERAPIANNTDDSSQASSSSSTKSTLSTSTLSTLTNDNFKKILIHVTHKFQLHLLQYLKETGDEYFEDLEFVRVEGVNGVNGVSGGNDVGGGGNDANNGDLNAVGVDGVEVGAMGANEGNGSSNGEDSPGMSMNVASIIAIVVGGAAFVVLMFASLKFYRKEKEFRQAAWKSRQLASSNAATHGGSVKSINQSAQSNSSYSSYSNPNNSIKSLKILYSKAPEDDFSFFPWQQDVDADVDAEYADGAMGGGAIGGGGAMDEATSSASTCAASNVASLHPGNRSPASQGAHASIFSTVRSFASRPPSFMAQQSVQSHQSGHSYSESSSHPSIFSTMSKSFMNRTNQTPSSRGTHSTNATNATDTSTPIFPPPPSMAFPPLPSKLEQYKSKYANGANGAGSRRNDGIEEIDFTKNVSSAASAVSSLATSHTSHTHNIGTIDIPSSPDSSSPTSPTSRTSHTSPPSPKITYTKKTCYAPPGKVGVAIDVIHNQPVVHKVKKGSPLEGMILPMDIVVAIDDVDTSCMSAADVTHLMVKRMNYRRKITFLRRDVG